MDYNVLLDNFINLHSSILQRDQKWYASMGETIGGSELATVMGLNPHKTLSTLVKEKKKIQLDPGSRPSRGVACFWGVMLEDIIGEFVQIDLGSKIKGDNICIRQIPGHRNSPDGYIIANAYFDEKLEFSLWTTDMEPRDDMFQVILLLEFKCPFTRAPGKTIPSYYKPQVWSGLAVSPMAHKGLFVDAVFRKCSLSDWGSGAEYDADYHAKDGPLGLPVAWGILNIYFLKYDSSAKDTRRIVKILRNNYFSSRDDDLGPIDFGETGPSIFNRMLYLVDQKEFKVLSLGMQFADGRGNIDATNFGEPLCDDYELLGFIPWKLFEVNYHLLDRSYGFSEKIELAVQQVNELMAQELEPEPIQEIEISPAEKKDVFSLFASISKRA